MRRMKMCPNCKTLNDDREMYCTECRYKLEGAEFIANPKHNKYRGLGCLIVLIIILIAVILAFVQPGWFLDESKKSFGAGFLRMIPSRPPPSASGWFRFNVN